MLLDIQGIVLRRTKYSEGSLIIELLTKEEGLLTIIAQGLKSKSGRARNALLQIGAVVDAVLYYKPGRNMHRLKSVQAGLRLQDIPFNFIKGSILLFCIELSRNALLKSGVDEQHFTLLKVEIQRLDDKQQGLAFFPLEFTLQLSHSLGFGIDWKSYQKDYMLDLEAGRFVPDIPPHPHYINTTYSKQYFWLGTKDPLKKQIQKPARQYLLEQSMLFFKLHIDQFKQPNSLDILTTIFKD